MTDTVSNTNTTPDAGAAAASGALDPIVTAGEHWRAHGWDEAADGMMLITSVMRAQQLLLAEVEGELRRFGLTFARFEVLRLLAFSRRGVLPIGKIGQRLQVHAASATSAVTRLERDGLARRSAHPDDGRSVLVEITDRGRTVVEQATEVLNERVFTRLPIDDAIQVELNDGLARLRHGLARATAPAADPDATPGKSAEPVIKSGHDRR